MENIHSDYWLISLLIAGLGVRDGAQRHLADDGTLRLVEVGHHPQRLDRRSRNGVLPHAERLRPPRLQVVAAHDHVAAFRIPPTRHRALRVRNLVASQSRYGVLSFEVVYVILLLLVVVKVFFYLFYRSRT